MEPTKTVSVPGLLMHRIKLQVQGCNRGKPKDEACKNFLVDAASRFLARRLATGEFDPAKWEGLRRFNDDRTRTTLLISRDVKDQLEDLRLRAEGKLLQQGVLGTFSLADIIEMGILCMEHAGFNLDEDGSLLKASEKIGLQPYAS